MPNIESLPKFIESFVAFFSHLISSRVVLLDRLKPNLSVTEEEQAVEGAFSYSKSCRNLVLPIIGCTLSGSDSKANLLQRYLRSDICSYMRFDIFLHFG